IERGIARGGAAQGRDITVAGRAGLSRGAGWLGPQCLTLLHPKERRIGGIVILHRARIRTGIVVPGPSMARADQQQRGDGERGKPVHVTVIATSSVWVTPWSSVNVSANVPLFSAPTLNDRNGLAALAGKKSASSTVSPSSVQMKWLMMSRGIAWPS